MAKTKAEIEAELAEARDARSKLLAGTSSVRQGGREFNRLSLSELNRMIARLERQLDNLERGGLRTRQIVPRG